MIMYDMYVSNKRIKTSKDIVHTINYFRNIATHQNRELFVICIRIDTLWPLDLLNITNV